MDPMLAALGTPLPTKPPASGPTKPPASRPTKPPASRPRIAVVAINSGNTNLGDEAVLMGALHVLRTRVADPAITVFSVNPADTSARHGVDAVPLPIGSMDTWLVRPARRAAGLVSSAAHRHRILAPAVRRGIRVVHVVLEIARQPASIARLSVRMRGTDLMILAGSNQMEDSGGTWGYPWVILLCTVIARLAGARVAFVSVGAGPLQSRFSQQMCVFALRLTTYASFRDKGSLELMRRLGYRGEGRVVPDLAYALEVPQGTLTRRACRAAWRSTCFRSTIRTTTRVSRTRVRVSPHTPMRLRSSSSPFTHEAWKRCCSGPSGATSGHSL